MPYGTMRFNMPEDSDFIPANPTFETRRLNPAAREQRLFPNETIAEWRSKKRRWSFSVSTGELESPFVLLEVDGRDINQVLARAWNGYGKDAVKRIVLNISVECREDETFYLLRHYGFERAGQRETVIPQLVYIGPAKQWKVGGTGE